MKGEKLVGAIIGGIIMGAAFGVGFALSSRAVKRREEKAKAALPANSNATGKWGSDGWAPEREANAVTHNVYGNRSYHGLVDDPYNYSDGNQPMQPHDFNMTSGRVL